MSYSIDTIQQSISTISSSKFNLDNSIHQLQDFLHKISQKSSHSIGNHQQISDWRQQFSTKIADINKTVKSSLSQLEMLKYQYEKLYVNVNCSNSPQYQRILALNQHFHQFNKKIILETRKGQQIIGGLQRWSIVGNQQIQFNEEQQSLLESSKRVKQTTQHARNVFTNLVQQKSMLTNAREKMSGVLKNINLAGNILQMMRTRSRQDNRLITILSFGLIVQIMLCIFIIRPWLRGQ